MKAKKHESKMRNTYLTISAGQTKKLGAGLAKEILKQPLGRDGVVLALEGELGAGKTTFLQGFAKGLGIGEKVLSPTFVIMRKIQMPKSKCQISPAQILRSKNCGGQESKCQMSKFRNFYHIDCYRIKGPEEILDLGLKEIIANPQNIIAIEWAERVKRILPEECFMVKLKFVNEKQRAIAIISKIKNQKSK